MKRVRDSGETMKYFPEEVVREILLRLPVKSLLRFRSVCKLWLSLISDPLFAKSHFELASNATNKLVYFTPSQTLSIDVDASFHDDSAVATLKFPITAPFKDIRILGSCRGFVLLEHWDNLFVWNPSTGFCKKTANYPISLENPYNYGFGYDSLNDYYLVVIASDDVSASRCETRIHFFSLKSSSWRKDEGTSFPPFSALDYQHPGIFLNGAIHWLALLFGGGGEVILAFDLIQKNARKLPLPNDYGVIWDLWPWVLGGCLSLISAGEFMTEIWIMKEYGVKSSWSKSIMVSVVETPIKYFFPDCFTKGGEIVGRYDGDGLVKCKLGGELLEHRTIGHDTNECQVTMYTECLLALPGDIEEGGGEGRQQ